MTHNFKLIERNRQWTLKLNDIIHSIYPKHIYSKQEAEDKASDMVQIYIKKYGAANVNYDGQFINS